MFNSDNGWSNGYDLGDSVTFQVCQIPYNGYGSYMQYLQANALVLNTAAQKSSNGNLTRIQFFIF